MSPLATGYRRALTSWADAFHPPARAASEFVSDAGWGVEGVRQLVRARR